MTNVVPRVGLLVTHPIQYYCPWYRALSRECDLEVFFSHRQTSEGQAAAGFGVAFEWDIPLLEGYPHRFLRNAARHPDVNTFWGCRSPELTGIIRERAFDAFIVHGWSTFSYWQAMLACWRTGTPILVRGDSSLTTPRSWWWSRVKFPIFRAFISKFDGYLVVGRRARDYVIHYGASPERCFSAPHSVDNTFFRERAEVLTPQRAEIRREFGVPGDASVFLFVGRFVERKQPEVFVRAVRRAAMRNPGIVGLMVGDGPLRGMLAQQVAASGVPVQFAGFLNQSEIVRAYVAGDVLVVPSTWETWGLVVNEAMACGMPAIVSDGVACAGDLVIDRETGEVFPIGDEDALVESMVRLADPAYRRVLAAAAVEQVKKFDISETVRGTLEAIHAVGKTGRALSSRRGVSTGRVDGASRT